MLIELNNHPIGLSTTIESEAYNEWLLPAFIEPLTKLGFRLESYAHIFEDSYSMGTHILRFNGPMDFDSPEYKQMIEICTQDDDGQPHATHRFYCGHLFLYIPYFG